MTRARLSVGLLLFASGRWPSVAVAAEPSLLATPVGTACGADNLLAGRLPLQWQDLRGRPALLTDEALAPEGAQWDAPVAVLLDTAAASVTYDLGQPTAVSALYVQADANDVYQIQGSLDGSPNSFKLLAEIDNVLERGHGLRTRWMQVVPVPVRFLRVGEATGDGLFSISEIAAYCRVPEPFPPVMRRVDAPPAVVPARPWYKLDWWGNDASARLELGLALFALCVLGWVAWAERTGRDARLPGGATRLVGGLAVAIQVGIALVQICATDWLPPWLPIAALYLACELILLVTLPAPGPATPLRWLLGRVRALGRPAASHPGSRRRRGKGPDPGAGADQPARPTPSSVVRNQLLVMVGILSFFAFWNFGAFHFSNYVHYHEAFHYYVGSKYFDELSYVRLYDCASIAEAENPALRRRVELRKIMDLRTNLLGDTVGVLSHPERCKQHFSPARWAEFKADTEYFRSRLGVKRWEEALGDHGYNATPVWNIAGSTLANLAPASDAQIWYLTRIDPALIIAMIAVIGWAFGWRVLCVALAVFATNFPSRFNWTGGAYLRWDFLFAMTAGVCAIKKDRPVLGGYLIGTSTLLRVFPGFLLLGPLLVIAQQLVAGRRRQLDRACLRVVLGAALAAATLVPISLATSGGIDGYRAFFRNSQKHVSTPLTNYMGWRTVVTYKERDAGRHLFSNRLADPWSDWKAARLRAFRDRKILYALGVLGFAALLWRAVRRVAVWEATALASVMIAAVPELTGYFYSFLIVPALLWASRRSAGLALLAVAAVTGFIDWAPTRFFPARPPWIYLQMSTWLDEQYTAMSVATLLGFVWILLEFGVERGAACPSSPGSRDRNAPAAEDHRVARDLPGAEVVAIAAADYDSLGV